MCYMNLAEGLTFLPGLFFKLCNKLKSLETQVATITLHILCHWPVSAEGKKTWSTLCYVFAHCCSEGLVSSDSLIHVN